MMLCGHRDDSVSQAPRSGSGGTAENSIRSQALASLVVVSSTETASISIGVKRASSSVHIVGAVKLASSVLSGCGAAWLACPCSSLAIGITTESS